ncbi:MAG: class I fructose-bisphosphate aldolase [Candidatus Limnocylindrales bacterium]
MGSLGKLVRLQRLRHPASGRIVTVALDHAPSYGLLSGLDRIESVLAAVTAGGPDAIMLMKGPATRLYEPYAGKIPLILKCSTLSPYHPEHDVSVSSAEDGVRLGADAIAVAVTFGSDDQPAHLEALAALLREAEPLGMPVIAHAYPNGRNIPINERYSAPRVAYASRAVMELGADIVKTFYTGSPDTFATVVAAAAPVPVVAAGGPPLASWDEVLDMARGAIWAGAAGVTFGRNIWQRPAPTDAVSALVAEVHGASAA